MAITVKLVGALRHMSGKTHFKINLQGESVKQLIEKMTIDMPEIKRTFSDQELNDSRSNSLVLVNGREISVLQGLNTKLADGDEVVFVPVVHGG